jgi:hypothetical protein
MAMRRTPDRMVLGDANPSGKHLEVEAEGTDSIPAAQGRGLAAGLGRSENGERSAGLGAKGGKAEGDYICWRVVGAGRGIQPPRARSGVR